MALPVPSIIQVPLVTPVIVSHTLTQGQLISYAVDLVSKTITISMNFVDGTGTLIKQQDIIYSGTDYDRVKTLLAVNETALASDTAVQMTPQLSVAMSVVKSPL